jgi:hypothetical protein
MRDSMQFSSVNGICVFLNKEVPEIETIMIKFDLKLMKKQSEAFTWEFF